jgi:molybdopterin/thiamine biosynthesis adenylyltransferase
MKSENASNLKEMISSISRKVTDPAGREIEIIEDVDALKLATNCNCTLFQIYGEALSRGIYPYRYIRNRESITLDEQKKLLNSRVTVIGCGGLGGHLILLLARIGIGNLVVVDSDAFDETNLNRQALSTLEGIGEPKVEQAVKLVAGFNPGVHILTHQVKLDTQNVEDILMGSDVVVDALDNVPDRFILEEATKSLGIPMIHGALAGFEGQLMTVFPEDPGVKNLYGDTGAGQDKTKSAEAVLGVPVLTASFIANLQAMEVIKVLLNRGNIFRNILVHVDLENGDFDRFHL